MRDPKDTVLKPLETNPARTKTVVLHPDGCKRVDCAMPGIDLKLQAAF